MSVLKYRKIYSDIALRQFEINKYVGLSDLHKKFVLIVLRGDDKVCDILKRTGMPKSYFYSLLYSAKPKLDYFEENAKCVRRNAEEKKKRKIIDNSKQKI